MNLNFCSSANNERASERKRILYRTEFRVSCSVLTHTVGWQHRYKYKISTQWRPAKIQIKRQINWTIWTLNAFQYRQFKIENWNWNWWLRIKYDEFTILIVRLFVDLFWLLQCRLRHIQTDKWLYKYKHKNDNWQYTNSKQWQTAAVASYIRTETTFDWFINIKCVRSFYASRFFCFFYFSVTSCFSSAFTIVKRNSLPIQKIEKHCQLKWVMIERHKTNSFPLLS